MLEILEPLCCLRAPRKLKICLAYWPSQWQSATTEETVVDLIFGVFSSREEAVEVVSSGMARKEWEEYKDQFVYEELIVDQYHPIPHI